MLLLFGAGLLLRTLHGGRGRRPRLPREQRADDDGRSAWRAVSDRRRRCCSSSTRSSARSAPCPASRSVAWTSTLPLGASDGGGRPSRSQATPPRGRTPASDRRLQIVSPTVLHDARPADRRGPRLHRPRRADGVPVCIVNEAFVRRNPRGPLAGRRACRAASAASRRRDAGGDARSSASRGR